MADLKDLVLAYLSVTALVYAQDDVPGYLKREHSLMKPYSGNGMSIPMWDFRDNVVITNNFIRLTQDHKGKRGSLWNRIPVYLRDWEMRIDFAIHGGGRTLAADGMAFWYTNQRMETGPVFGSRDKFEGLGVFLDTYKNGPQIPTFPYITAMVNNGSDMYDHINDGQTNSVGSCLASFRNKDYETMMAVRYVKEQLKVSLNIDGTNEWRECFFIDGVTLPMGYFFGVSAATGDLADNHDIRSIKLYEIEVQRDPNELDGWATAVPGVKSFKAVRDVDDDSYRSASMSGFKLFLIVICALLGLGVCVVVGFVVFQKRQEQSRKRFY